MGLDELHAAEQNEATPFPRPGAEMRIDDSVNSLSEARAAMGEAGVARVRYIRALLNRPRDASGGFWHAAIAWLGHRRTQAQDQQP